MPNYDEIVKRNINDVTSLEFFDDITEGEKPADPNERYRVYEFFLYDDSLEPDWMDFISSLHIQAYAIHHDKDIYLVANPSRNIVAGQPKKPHWHVWLNWPGKKKGITVIEVAARCHGVHLQEKSSSLGSCRYLCHMDDKDKYQYDPHDVLQLGGSQDYLEYCLSKSDGIQELVGDMCAYIVENDITNFTEFSMYCKQYNKLWFDVISSKRSLFFITFLKSNAYRIREEIGGHDS